MADAAVENAIIIVADMADRIAAAEAQIKEWKARRDRAERFIADWQEFSGQSVPVRERGDALVPSSATMAKSKPANPKKEAVAESAREILLANGSPMPRDELFAALADKGVIIHGQNPAVVLQTMLWRTQDRIVHLKGYGYWPTDVPNESVGYDPALMREVIKGIAL